MSESVGKISLDLEVQSDISNQIKDEAQNIGKQIEQSLKNVDPTETLRKTLDNFTAAIDTALKNTMANLSKEINEYLKRLTSISAPRMAMPEPVSPSTSTPATRQGRSPPTVRMPRVNTGFNADEIRSQMQSVVGEMDNIEAAISLQRQRLADLRDQYRNTFNDARRTSIEEQMLRLDRTIIRLGSNMDRLSARYHSLEGSLSESRAINMAPHVVQVENLGNAVEAFRGHTTQANSQLRNMSTLLRNTFSVSGIRNLLSHIRRIPESSGKASESLRNLNRRAGEFSRSARTAGNNTNYFGSGIGGTLKQMMKWMIILPAIASGIKAFASNLLTCLKTNSQFSASLNQIYSSLWTAFMPIYQAILPAINTLMSALSTAAAYIASFINSIFGKTYSQGFQAAQGMVVAKEAMGAYGNAAKSAGASVTDAAKASKEAQKEMMGFDQINKLTENSDTGGGSSDSGESGAPALVTPPIAVADLDAATTPWAEKFKNVLSKIFQPFQQAWAAEGQNTITAMKNALNSVWQLVKDVGKSFLEIWTNGSGLFMLTTILQVFQNIFDIVGNIAAGLDKAWNKNQTGTAILQEIFNIFNIILTTIRDITKSTSQWSKKLNFSPLLESIKNLFKTIEPLSQNVGEGLKYFWDNILLPIAGWTVQTAVPAFLDMLSASLDVLNSVIEALEPFGTWLFEEILSPLAEWTGDIFIGALETITDLLGKFSDWCSEHQSTIETIAIIVGSFATAIGIVTGAITAFNGVAKVCSGVVSAMQTAFALLTSPIGIVIAIIGAVIAIGILLWKNWDTIKQAAVDLWEKVVSVFEDIKNAISDKIDAAKEALSDTWDTITDTASRVVTGIKDTVTEKFEEVKDGISNAIEYAKESTKENLANMKQAYDDAGGGISGVVSALATGVKGTFSSAYDYLNELTGGRLGDLKENIGNVLDSIGGAFSSAWEGVKTVTGNVFDGIKTGIGNAMDSISSGISNVLGTIKNVFSTVWEAIVNVVRTPVNSIIGFINGLIDGVTSIVNGIASMLNSISIDLPGWLEDLTGYSSFGFNLPYWDSFQIPYLAKGGVIEQPTLAMMGEQGKEAVVPLENNRQWISKVASEMKGMQGTAGSTGISKEELESIINKAVLRIIAALAGMGFYLEGEELAKATRSAAQSLDTRFNPVEVL